MYFESIKEYTKYLVDRKRDSEKIRRAYDLLEESDDNIDQVISDQSLSPQEYIEVIALRRKEGYSKSSGSGNISSEHQTDLMYMNTPWKFVEEFLQNADDCKYQEKPEIEIIVNEKNGTVEFIYNEEGFSREDIWALTSFEQSTKNDENDGLLESNEEGIFYKEKTGRKGIGFKSVFSLKAFNIRIHIKSKEYSLILDRNVGSVMPIWESGYEDDGKTHVIVELIKPEYSLKEIYPKFKEIFCIQETSHLFARNPALFMHRLKDITVKRIIGDVETEFFTILLDYNHSDDKYEEPFVPENTILAGIRFQGKYYRKQFSHLNIYLKSKNQNLCIPCVRETQMVNLHAKYRNISIITPILTKSQEIQWEDGALFRTFPLMDNVFQIPFSIDAPFELNTARKAIEYNDANGARNYNNKIISLLFDGDGLLVDFLLFLRNIDNIQIDRYFKKNKVTLFENDANKDDNKRLIPIVNITTVMRDIPVFFVYGDKDFIPYNRIFSVDSDLYSWLDAEKFLSKYVERGGSRLASEIYADNHIMDYRNIIDEQFAQNVNDYLNSIEGTYGIESREYLSFIEKKLYPFLQRNEQKLCSYNAYDTLKVFISCIKGKDGIYKIRETCKEGQWFTFTRENNYSIWKYRVVESSPVVLEPLINILKREANLKQLDEVFSEDINKEASFMCNDWSDVREFIKTVYYYGYSLDNIKIDVLNNYAVSKSIDTYNNNYLRDVGILKTIPDEDINELSVIFNSISNTVAFLYNIGLKKWWNFGKPLKNNKRTYTLKDESLKMIQSSNVTAAKDYLHSVIKICKDKDYKILLPFESFDDCDIDIKLILIRYEQFILSEDYKEICDSILSSDYYWKKDSDKYGELIIRARMKSNKAIPSGRKPFSITLKYVIDHKLESYIHQALDDLQFNYFRIVNNGFFEEIRLEEIYNTIAFLLPQKLSFVKGKKDIHFYKGDLSRLPQKNRYLIDGSGVVVFLHVDTSGNYNDSLARYLNTSFDPIDAKYFAELEVLNQGVYEKYIEPVFNTYGYNLKEVFHRVSMDFPSRTDEEYIKILSWFRKQSYVKELGNASKNNENEIEEDYAKAPWRFVYEFIQNVDDCTYPQSVIPKLGIDIDEEHGAITFRYNEIGFTREDVDALTKFADSNKIDVLDTFIPEAGLFNLEKTGRKGRGFKSVFSLPGKDISVLIESNGFSFRFYKRIGQIVPFWVSSDSVPDNGSRITIEGFRPEDIGTIYQRLKNVFGISNLQHFFSDCPLLFLRKLKSIIVKNNKDYFIVDVKELKKRATYSNEEVNIGQSKVVSGIYYENQYRLNEFLPLKIKVVENGNTCLEIDAVRYSQMFNSGFKTRTVSLSAPIITRETKVGFDRGGLYNTLPLEKNIFKLPVAINAPFDTDAGRSKVDDVRNALHNEILNILNTSLFPELYRYIRAVHDISIKNYIISSKDYIFEGYNILPKIDLRNQTRAFPVVKLEAGDAYISVNNARMLPPDCYNWINPVDLAESFLKDAKNVLVDRQYIDSKIDFSSIKLLDGKFVENLNRYINTLSQISLEDICALMHNHILPFITNNYEEIRKAYRIENKVEELKKLRVFVFKMADGEYVIESAEEQRIWLESCPERYQSYGNYRVLNNSPVGYTEEQLRWIREIHETIDFNNAFSRNEFAARNINTWEETKTLLETILYYGVTNNIYIPFLGKCILDETYDPEENIFRDAYKETQSRRIAAHLINEQDIDDIWTDVGDVWQGEPRDIADFIIKSGLRRGNDFFKVTRKTVNCDEETISVFEEYCLTKEKSERVLSLVIKAWEKRNESRNIFEKLILDFESIKDCSPAFLTSLFSSDFMEKGDMAFLARQFYNADIIYSKNADYTEALLYAARLLDNKSVSKDRDLNISLSEILERKMGKCIQDVMLKLESKIELYITTSQELQLYPNEQINKALQWLSDSDSRDKLSKDYLYYMTEIKEAFPQRTPESSMYLIDSEKVILNASSPRDRDGLNTFVSRHYGGDDREFSALLSIIREQERLKNWEGTKKKYIDALRSFRIKTDGLKKVLYPGMMDNINNANSASQDYIIPELLQNINDCKCTDKPDDRFLQIDIDLRQGIMKLMYDEDGFDFKNVYSITALGQSSKHDSSEGEKGLGFKKVFTLFDYVEIYSNGFSFKLTKDQETIPRWIESQDKINENSNENGTTMVFSTGRLNDLNRLAKQWEYLFFEPYTEGQVSPLFLETIARYKLNINGNRTFSVTRNEIIKGYHFIKKPLLKMYTDLLLKEESEETVNNILSKIREALRKRIKCKAMSDTEFEDYINNIDITICFPDKIEKKIEGVFYSTLPTKTVTNSALFINLPLELTTGRDAVLKGSGSAYNKCIMDMVFRCGEQVKSVYGILLEEVAESMPDKEVFEYISPDILKWISNLAEGNESKANSLKKELQNLRLFHSYPDNKLVALNESYSVDSVIYQYLLSGAQRKNDIERWIRQHYVPANKMHMINIQKNVVKTTEALEKFVDDLGIQGGKYPLSKSLITMVYDYFAEEYDSWEG